MIPAHSPSRLTTENGVKERIAACRQRLRNSRITHKATNNSQIDHPTGFVAPATRVMVSGAEQLATAEIVGLEGFIRPLTQLILPAKELEEVGIT